MAVNERVYGAKEKWIDLANTEIKLANFGTDDNVENSRLKAGYSNNKFTINKPLDNSICHSALGTESVISHIKYYYNGEMKYEDNNIISSFAFANGWDCHANYIFSFSNWEDLNYNNPVGMVTPKTNDSVTNFDLQPIVDFDYKKLRARIFVVASSNKSSGFTAYHFDDYCKTGHNSKPYVNRVSMMLYYKGQDGQYKEIGGSGKGILLFNNTNLYNKFINTETGSHFNGGTSALMIGTEVPSGYTPANGVITFIGQTSIYGGRSQTVDGFSNGYLACFTDGGNIEKIGTKTYFWRQYDESFKEFVLRQLACFGIQYVENINDINIDLEDSTISDETANKVYMGVLDENYIGHGDYVRGKAIRDLPQYNFDSANDSPFDPNVEIDPNTYHDTSIKPINVDGNTSFTTKYVLNYGQLNSIAEDFYKALNTKPEDLSYSEYSNSLFLTNNAIDTVVSCKYFPFQLPMTGGENVKMGNYTIKVNNEPLVAPITSRKVSVYEFECGSCYGEFGDFRDFEPYTSYELKVPFCGSVRLNASECVGKSITVSLAVDIESGSCTGFVYAGDKLVESVSGSCGVDIPISAVQQATLDSQIFNASINQRQAKTNAVLSVAKGAINVGAGAYALSKAKTPRQIGTSSSYLARGITDSLQDISNSMYNAERANYNISHVEIPYKCVGAVSSGVCLSESLLCSLIKETPIMLDDYNPDVYAKTIGFACCKSGKIGSESGMVVCSDVRIENCSLTKTEKDMIIQLCKTGIIV